MKIRTTKSTIPKKDKDLIKWYLIDAKDRILGRLATEIAKLLMGKHKPVYTPHLDMGDFVVVINAEKIKTTGKKYEKKMYYHHSGYVGGIKKLKLREVMLKKPEEVLKSAVKNMLPKNILGRKIFSKLFVYKDTSHPHNAQKPVPYNLKNKG